MIPRPSAVAALLLFAASATACLPGRGLPGTSRSRAPEAGDTVVVAVDNQNYLSATVRLFSRGSQVRRISVTGLQSDTVYLTRSELRMPGQVTAIVELVGSREAYRIPETILPADASLIDVQVAQLLSTSTIAVY